MEDNYEGIIENITPNFTNTTDDILSEASKFLEFCNEEKLKLKQQKDLIRICESKKYLSKNNTNNRKFSNNENQNIDKIDKTINNPNIVVLDDSVKVNDTNLEKNCLTDLSNKNSPIINEEVSNIDRLIALTSNLSSEYNEIEKIVNDQIRRESHDNNDSFEIVDINNDIANDLLKALTKDLEKFKDNINKDTSKNIKIKNDCIFLENNMEELDKKYKAIKKRYYTLKKPKN